MCFRWQACKVRGGSQTNHSRPPLLPQPPSCLLPSPRPQGQIFPLGFKYLPRSPLSPILTQLTWVLHILNNSRRSFFSHNSSSSSNLCLFLKARMTSKYSKGSKKLSRRINMNYTDLSRNPLLLQVSTSVLILLHVFHLTLISCLEASSLYLGMIATSHLPLR